MAGFLKDVEYMGAMQGISAGPRDRYARCLAIVHAAVPCREDLVGVKSTAVPITIVRVLSDGFSSAPYVMAKKGAAPPPPSLIKPDPLFRTDMTTTPPSLDVWSYVSKGMNRGPREGGVFVEGGEQCPPMYVIKTGTSFVMFINSLTFQSQAATSCLPSDVSYIPAMSLVELTISPRHVDSCTAGRGINVKSMRVAATEIDAVFQRGVESIGMPSTAAEASRRAVAHREMYPALLKDVEDQKVSFVVPSSSLNGAYMGELPTYATTTVDDADSTTASDDTTNVQTFVKLVVGAGTTSFPSCEYVDIPVSSLKKQTNTGSDEHACAMLDIALAMGAVHLWVVCDDRWANKGDRSCYRAVPVIDTTIMFAALDLVRSMHADYSMVAQRANGTILVDMEGSEILKRVEFIDDEDDDRKMLVLSTGIEYDDGVLELNVTINEEDLSKTQPKSILPQSNVALAICGPYVHTSKGYKFEFGVRCADASFDVPRVLHGYINRAPNGGGGSGIITRKRKAISME
jgi:hypothetical protein